MEGGLSNWIGRAIHRRTARAEREGKTSWDTSGMAVREALRKKTDLPGPLRGGAVTRSDEKGKPSPLQARRGISKERLKSRWRKNTRDKNQQGGSAASHAPQNALKKLLRGSGTPKKGRQKNSPVPLDRKWENKAQGMGWPAGPPLDEQISCSP